jgi:multidrug resistance efflux pump
MKKSQIVIAVVVVLALVAAGLWGYQTYLAPTPEPTPAAEPAVGASAVGPVSAEGRVQPASQASLGFAQGGRVAEVLVQVGQTVSAGDPLLRLDTTTLEASVSQAQAALAVAQANLAAAQTQAQQQRQALHTQEAAGRTSTWGEDLPSAGQPTWYFTQAEQVSAAQAELAAARTDLAAEQQKLDETLQTAGGAELLAIEARLAEAQAAYRVAQAVLERTRQARDAELQNEAQQRLEAVESRLEAAQNDYEERLTSEEAADVLEARTRLALAQERYDTALDRLYALQTGDYALALQAIADTLLQAQAAVTQTLTALEAANVALEQATLVAPLSGVVVSLAVEPGEIAAPGLPVIILADLTHWQVATSDLAENDVALITVGMRAQITLDAFPGQTFTGVIREIDLQGEDNRGAVTYTVTLDFDPGPAAVRWGMTAFVDIEVP